MAAKRLKLLKELECLISFKFEGNDELTPKGIAFVCSAFGTRSRGLEMYESTLGVVGEIPALSRSIMSEGSEAILKRQCCCRSTCQDPSSLVSSLSERQFRVR
jgi:hypothetical protein